MPRAAREQVRYVNPNIDQTKAMQMYMNGKMDTEIALRFGVDVRCIRFWRELNGMESNQGIRDWQHRKCRQCDSICKVASGEKLICKRREVVS